MKLKYTAKLTQAKLKVRKRRTALTVLASSLLFGVVLSGVFLSQGLVDNLLNRAHNLLGDKIYVETTFLSGEFNSQTGEVENEFSLKTKQRALELYENSTDEGKQYPILEVPPLAPFLDSNNPFTIQAVAEFTPQAREQGTKSLHQATRQSGGDFVELIKAYDLRGSIQPEDEGSDAITNSQAVQNVSVINSHEFMSAFSKTSSRDDAIQIVIPFDKAAYILGVNPPNFASTNPATALNDFIEQVSEKAIGYEFKRDVIIGKETISATFEIAGLVPPENAASTLDPYSVDPFLSIYKTISSTAMPSTQFKTFIANPDSSAFKNLYRPSSTDSISGFSTGLITFQNPQDARKFIEQTNCEDSLDCGGEPNSIVGSRELINNTLGVQTKYQQLITPIIIGIVIFLTIVAAFIMAGTISRVILDEQPSIALYRAVGATSTGVIQIYVAHIFTLCAMIIISSIAIGGVITGAVSLGYNGLISANMNALYGSISPNSAIIFGVNTPLITLVLGAVLITGLICLGVSFRKLRAKNIVKEIKQ